MARFVDHATVHLQAGDGGNGCASVLREKFKPLGGPDGGNGGNGGDIILRVDPDVHTLLDFHYRPHLRASSGKPGMGGNRHGANGAPLIVRVPPGTVVLDADGEVLADLIGADASLVVARGGRGGLGNAALVSKARRAPGFALLGEPGERVSVTLELTSVADVGLIGFPSAGKSSLVSVLSAAKPKIADYPFTTLQPHLGVVSVGADTFTVADVPGLIPGASRGKGLGLEFLRHIERCAVLVHVVDCAAPEVDRDPISDVAAIEAELAHYSPALPIDLADKPRIVALNKIDVPAAREMAEFQADDLRRAGYQVLLISTATGEGLDELRYAMAAAVAADRAARPAPEPAPTVLRPRGVDEPQFTIEPDEDLDGAFVVRGRRPERWIAQTAFDNEEAVGFLADRLAKLGVEDRLRELGAEPGAAVTIGDVTFDWYPTVGAGLDDQVPATRGTDPRLHADTRVSAAERKALHRIRRGLPVEVDGPDDGGRGRRARR